MANSPETAEAGTYRAQGRASDSPLDNGCVPRQAWFVNKILDSCSGLTLDVGCGRGLWSGLLRKKGLAVVSLDLSARRIQMCRAEGNSENMLLGSSVRLPFKSASFDTVIFLEVIEHLEKAVQVEALEEIARVLKDGGTIVLTTPNRPIYRLLSKYLHLFGHNPEHVGEMTLGEARAAMEKQFRVTFVDGKMGFLDRLIPTFLCWDLMLVGKKG